jgi:hypothetical protein
MKDTGEVNMKRENIWVGINTKKMREFWMNSLKK